jgi:hypothetical protein
MDSGCTSTSLAQPHRHSILYRQNGGKKVSKAELKKLAKLAGIVATVAGCIKYPA